MAWVSLGKLLLFACALVYLGIRLTQGQKDTVLHSLWSVRVILLSLLAFALSLGWSEAPSDIALMAFAKHSKLLEIALLVSLIRNAREARLAVAAFLVSQAFFILSSWLMVAGFRVPWATSMLVPELKFVVYSTYLDQTLIFSAAAAVFWHLRKLWPRASWAAGTLAIAALVNNLFFQEGRTGYLSVMVVATLIIVWQMPKNWQLATLVLAPLLLLTGAYVGSDKLQARLSQVATESQSYAAQGASETSSGFRLHAWRRSLQAMAQQPVVGHGVGSWTQSVKRIEGANAQQVFGDNPSSNPHQEFLLWGVELGVGGTLLLLVLIASVVRDAWRFTAPIMRATLSVLAVMGVACLFNSSLYDALIGDFFCITLGLLLALGVRGQASDSTSVHPDPTNAAA